MRFVTVIQLEHNALKLTLGGRAYKPALGKPIDSYHMSSFQQHITCSKKAVVVFIVVN